ncbi:MAG: energy transducer TonB [candidate division WOR-3 bacterium]|nr:MAG: energy transducer TonB [candidate division WOR-3 bacterium]
MKYVVCAVFCVLLFSCATKREMLVPVLLDYDLDYPDEARRQGMEGTVYVRVLVGRSGKASNAMIAKTSGNQILDSAAIRTARTFRFSPAMAGEEVLQSWVMVPIEFKFREVEYTEWFAEVEVLQKRIERQYDREAVDELYELYRQMIFSPWDVRDVEFNEYVKAVVVEGAAKIWESYWSVYPARVVLFVDIITRYPDSFTALKARADLNNFMEQEKIKMRHSLDPVRTDTLINRILEAVKL